jgi:hypothetical protein
MLRPHGAHLFIGRKLAPRNFLVGGGKIGVFLGGQLNHGLLFPCQLQEHAGKLILHRRGQGADGLNSVFKEFGHAPLYHELPLPEQPKTRLTSARHFCTKKALVDQGDDFCA